MCGRDYTCTLIADGGCYLATNDEDEEEEMGMNIWGW